MGDVGAVVVGTGFGCLTHVRALRAAGFEVRALVGRDPARTTERAGRFDIPFATTDLAAALAQPGTEIVAIATPPATHCQLALESVKAGRHVLCEKPFAMDAGEAEQMLGAADEAGVVHMLGCEFRFSTGQALLRRVVADGSIGEPRLATFMLHMPLLSDPSSQVPDWWSDSGQGGGWLGAHAAHVVDQVRTTLGELADVSAGLNVVSNHPWSAEDSYTVHFTTVAGVPGVMQSSAGTYGPPLLTTRIAGSTGTCWLEGDKVYVADQSGVREVDVPDDLVAVLPDPPPQDLMVTAYDWMHSTGIDMGPYIRLYETFRDLVNGVRVAADPPAPTFADGVASMVALDAIRRSSAERVRVRLP